MTPDVPVTGEQLPVDPEGLVVYLSRGVAVFAYWQGQAESLKTELDRLRNEREQSKAMAFLGADGPIDVRKAVAQVDPDVIQLTSAIEAQDHAYRAAQAAMNEAEQYLTAAKKILSWRMEELRLTHVGEPPVARGNALSFDRRRDTSERVDD